MARPFRPALSYSVAIVWLAADIVLASVSTVWAKAPGKSHCYRSVCVKVLTVGEVQGLLGKTVRMTASHYGDPSVDPFNRGTYTSNGERFDANDPTRTASATFPDGTELLLRNPATGAVSHVRVNDFGPFWFNRELDVTEGVARDLGFEKQGIKSLEVIVVSVPTGDDVKRLYRHNRPLVPTMGYLGIRTAADTAKLAQVLMRRDGGIVSSARQLGEQGSHQLHSDTPGRIVMREQVYHFVPKLTASPRALGAEDVTPEHVVAGSVALKQWSKGREAYAQLHSFAFALFGSFVLLAFAAPYGAPLLLSGVKQSHRFLTYDDAVEHLKSMLAYEHPSAPARLAHDRQPQFAVLQAEHFDEDPEAAVATTYLRDDAPAAEKAMVSARAMEPIVLRNASKRRPTLLRFEKFELTAPMMRFRSDRSLNEVDHGISIPKKVARIIGEGVCHEGDLSSNDAIIISGRVIGTVRSAQVTIEASGQVDGDVIADLVKVEGWINGHVEAQKVDLEAAALVSGDVRAMIINSANGAQIEGRDVELPIDHRQSLLARLDQV